MPPAPKLLTHLIKDVMVATFVDAHIRDLPQIEQIVQQLYDLVEHQDCRKVVIDFAKVQTFSSQALGILLTLDKKLAAIKGKLVLCGVRPEIIRLFEIARLHKHFKIAADQDAALAVFGVTKDA